MKERISQSPNIMTRVAENLFAAVVMVVLMTHAKQIEKEVQSVARKMLQQNPTKTAVK